MRTAEIHFGSRYMKHAMFGILITKVLISSRSPPNIFLRDKDIVVGAGGMSMAQQEYPVTVVFN